MCEYNDYYRYFSMRVSSGEFCRGEECHGWFLSNLDTWHACGCGKGTEANHPENSYYEDEEAAPPPAPEPAFGFAVTFKEVRTRMADFADNEDIPF